VPYLLLAEVLKGDLTFSPSRPRNRKHCRDVITSNPSARQFDLSTLRSKVSHDQWHEELSQLNNTEGEDGDLGLRAMNEDVDLEVAQQQLLQTPTSTLRPSSPRLPSRPGTPIPSETFDAVDTLTAHIRSAATMLAQLNSKTLPTADVNAIRTRILAEMSNLEEQRLALSIATEDNDTSIERTMVDKDDPSAAVFAEDWNTKRERIRRQSAWGNLPGWELCSVIIKSDAEMEEVGSQLIAGLKRIWDQDGIDVWLRRYFPPSSG